MPFLPYGINPSAEDMRRAMSDATSSYDKLPETTCSHLNCCCKAGCPNMYYVEFLNIYHNHVMQMSPTSRIELTCECVRRYLTNQADVVRGKTKPCVFLGEDTNCQVYDHRPLKCRLYGLIPDSLYKWIVKSVSKDSGIHAKDIPLCTQCNMVKVKPEYHDKFPDNKVPEDLIKEMERTLRSIDRSLGMSEQIQKKGFGFLTYHDWHLMFELGEGCMADMTQLRMRLTDEEKEHFIASLKDALSKRGTKRQ